jgi:hypothetical protein
MEPRGGRGGGEGALSSVPVWGVVGDVDLECPKKIFGSDWSGNMYSAMQTVLILFRTFIRFLTLPANLLDFPKPLT